MKKIFLFFLLILLLLSAKPKSVFAQTYCATKVNFPVCIKLDVSGNAGSESMQDYWQLVKNACWKFDGISNKYNNATHYKLQVKIESPIIYEGQEVTPVDFAKNHQDGYWAPGNNLNLRWLVVNFGQSPDDYMWVKGDKRYDRTSLGFTRRFRYDSLNPGHPPYILIPRVLQPNPENNGLTNSFSSRHQYYSCYSSENCDLTANDGHNSWFIGITNTKVQLPYNNYQWVDAKRVEFVELSLPGSYNDGVNDPYSSDRNFACRMNGEVLYYRGVREDWYFVKNIGLVLILTRDVGLGPDNECVYEVAREDLSFDNADTYSYLIKKDFNNYDPEWNYSPPPPQCNTECTANSQCPSELICSITPGFPTGFCRNPSCTEVKSNCVCATATPTLTPTPTPKPGDLDSDGDVDMDDFKKMVAEFGHPYTIFDYNILVGNFGK